ncbi:MAG TPA: amino acid permease, partial [Micromonosporaceae bacterium]|nr:amino acid permease [Micromonosporaceae bacterium]
MSTTTAAGADATGIPESQDAQDAAALAKLGYRQQLTRALGLSGNFAIGFTYLSPLVGVYSLFTYGLSTGGPAMFWSIPLVMLGQMFVMLTFAEVSSQYPIAGGIFQWSKNLVGPRYAWLSGWIYTWALLITVGAVAWPIATYAGPLFGYRATYWTTIITALVVILFAAGVNLAGVRRLAVVAYFGVAVEVIGTIGIGVYLMITQRTNSFGSIFHTFGAGQGGYLGAFAAACLFAVWIFYGFEACGDIAEEVKDPSRKIPKAMGWTLGVGGVTTIILTLGLMLAVPSIPDVIAGKDADAIGSVFAVSIDKDFGTVGTKFVLALLVTIASVAFPISTYAGPLFGYKVTTASTITTAVVVILLAAGINLAGVRRLAVVAYVGVGV